MISRLSLLLGIIFWNFSFAQTPIVGIGATSDGMGNCGLTSSNVFASFNNSALLVDREKAEIGFYSDTRYLIAELYSHYLAINVPTSFSMFGIGFNYQGFSAYNSINTSLSIAKTLFKELAIGVQVNYQSIQTSENFNSQQLDFQLGTYFPINHNTSIGAQFSHQKHSQLVGLGGTYTEENWGLYADLIWDINKSLTTNMGAEYFFCQSVALRAGIADNLSLPTFGIGFFLPPFNFNTSIAYHQHLGLSPTLDLSYTFEK